MTNFLNNTPIELKKKKKIEYSSSIKQLIKIIYFKNLKIKPSSRKKLTFQIIF